MKKGLSGFFKSPAFARLFFVFGAAFFATLAISCRQLASFDPVVNGGNQTTGSGGSGGTSSEPTEFSFDLKASHGLKRKISLEWNSFSGASYYEIYFAESSSAEFVKIGEAQTNSFEDNVGAGRTGYFRVRAVKPNGASSPFSSTVVGTSLAMPIISGGEVDEFEATVTWSMENARGIDGTDYYESSLIFEVVCQSKDGVDSDSKVLPAVDLAGSSYSCKFEGLSSSRDYEFYVKAYLEGDAQNEEQSPTVDKTTLTAYTPLAPKFTASEGDSAKGISLLITLPEMVTVMTYLKDSENSKEMQDVLYPLFFEVYRKTEGEKEYSANPTNVLYFDGKEFTTSPIEYEEGGKPYEAGAQVVWFDKDANIKGGEKYDYMIRSVVDANYSKVVCPEDKQYDGKTGTPESMATTARGWKSAHPSFNVEIGKRELSADEKEVVSVSVGFSAKWNDLGKAENYKFAIKRFHTPFNGTSSSEPSWLKNGETIYFDTLSEVKSKVDTFGSKSGRLSDAEQGTYSYTLYIVAKIDNGTEKIDDESNILDSMDAIDRIVVTKEVNLPKAELAVRDGYKDKVILEILACEKGVTYSVERKKMVDGSADEESKESFDLVAPENGSFVHTDTTNMEGNCTYSYVLKAVAASGVYSLSKTQIAETLGTPIVTFRKEEYTYDSITISFDTVLAAKEYVVKLGENGGFGGGKEYKFDVENVTSSQNSNFLLAGSTYNVTIDRPIGYDNALTAGLPANLTVTAVSGVKDEAPSEAVPVNVVGPASLATRANTYDEATDDSISVSWNKVEGANGYLIRRVMYSDTEMKEVAEASDVTYYYNGVKVTLVDESSLGGRASVSVSSDGGRFTLTDNYMEADEDLGDDDPELKNYQMAQSKIPWGLPFRYVVLPVLDKSDFDFKGASLELADGDVLYNNLKQTEGCAALGYGLEVHAEKSKSAMSQKITWKKPFYADKYPPRVFKRVAEASDSDKFTRVGDPTANAEYSYTPSGEEIYGAYEYIVKYNAYETVDLHKSLADEFKKLKDSESETEQANKGYLFTVKASDLRNITLSAAQGGSNEYAEYITWNILTNIWDPKTRALGPTGIKLYIRNNNLDADWHEAASINSLDSSGSVTALGDDVSATKYSKGISLYPTTCANGTGTTAGLLKVLRDYKHYYAIALTRGDDGNEGSKIVEVRYTPGFGDFTDKNKVVTYRRITDEELVRAATLAMSIGMENSRPKDSGWVRTGEPSKTWNGASGSVYTKWNSCTLEGLKSTHEYHTITFTDLVANMTCKSLDEVTSFLQVTGEMHGIYVGSIVNSVPPTYYNGDITVKNIVTGEEGITIKFDEARKDSNDKIKLIRNGIDSLFGNVTPLPYDGYQGGDFFNDSDEWQ